MCHGIALRSSSTKSLITPRIPTCTPVRSSEDASGKGDKRHCRLRRVLVRTQPGSLVRERPAGAQVHPLLVRTRAVWLHTQDIHPWQRPNC